jgi:choline dehydrogenase-like flavoprotein
MCTGANTNLSTVMLAEKIADDVLSDRKTSAMRQRPDYASLKASLGTARP